MNKKNKGKMSDSPQISTVELIKEVQKSTDIFRSPTGEAFIKTKDENKIALVESEEFTLWLRRFVYQQFKIVCLTQGTVMQVLGHMQMLACDSEVRKLHRRIYDKDNAVYYDLGLDGARYLKITKDEIKVVRNSSLLMMRSQAFCPQVEPDLEVSPEEILGFVDKHFHFSSDSEKLLFSVFLVTSFFVETMSMPVIQLYGEKGSGKTFCERRILDLLNPVSTGIYAMPDKKNDFTLCLSSDFVTAFDNVGWINAEKSNILCIASTGGEVPMRKLFHDNVMIHRDLKGIVIFNSVHQCVTKSDLADRILLFQLERFNEEDRKGEKELGREWELDKPRFFGAICRAVQGVLGDGKKTKHTSPFRLVDFYELAVKAGRQIGFTEEEVHKAFKDNHSTINESIVEGDIVMLTVEKYMERYNEGEVLKFTPTELFIELKLCAYEELDIRRGFPGAPGVLTKKLIENKSNLEEIGIYFCRSKPKSRYIEIWKNKK